MSDTKLNEILDVDVPTGSPETWVDITPIPAPDLTHYANNSVEQDATESRTYIRTAMAQLSTAITEMMAVAKASGKPRAYEVVTQMLRSLAEMQQDLMGSHQSEQVLGQPELGGGEVHNHIEQAVFVGSTSELSELVRQKRLERAEREANTITVSATDAANT
jgi:uncharacterized protein YbjT (DUF2867 family)